MTIFMIMVIFMVAAVLFTLIEGVRYAAANRMSREYADMAVESAFSYYVRPMWDAYGILGIDLGFGSDQADLSELNGRIDDILYNNCMRVDERGRVNLIGISGVSTKTDSYKLLTDDNGVGFIKEAADTVTVNEIAGLLENEGVDLSLTDLDLDALMEQGTEALISGETESTESSASTPAVEAIAVDQNPVDTVVEWKDRAILSQVLDVNTVSTTAISTESLVSHRELQTGTAEADSASAIEKLLFRKYVIDTMQSYVEKKGRSGIAYELEYILSGKESDAANLEGCVTKLLAVREVENYIAILQDESKKETAYAIALGLSGETLSPAVVEIVKYAVIAAWAYVESILDVRLLLAGGKVPMIKSASEWTSDPTQLAAYLDTSVKARDCSDGLSYSDYIYQMLVLTDDKTMAFRTMDVMEYRIRQDENYSQFKMDNVLYEADFDIDFHIKPLFLAFAGINSGGYTVTREADLSYA